MMLKSIIHKILFFGLFCETLSEINEDYYWRDYTGEIPFDVVPGGRDVNRKPTYIGQVYIKEFGIAPANIYPPEKTVYAPMFGVKKSENHVKILCSQHTNDFKWIPANASSLHLTTSNKHLVRGGVEDNYVLNVGRINYQGELIVGKVVGFIVGDAKMYFVYKDQEKSADSYEVLTFNNTSGTDFSNIIDVRKQKE